ncbi:transcriptional regulator [Saccharopolyspora cebuensis]|uniref:Transcriptional regulator n=1 Tax=Saccharopolyspora cebuensis TaxID=418759 RepID=A0ABV4CRZ5_9PSEU
MGKDRPDPATWDEPAFRALVECRDIAGLYRRLNHRGWSQRRIAILTGQAQSEVAEIIGGRQVQGYALLCRIAEGLGIPRGRTGLAYTTPRAANEENERMHRRQFLGLVSQIIMGAELATVDLDLLATPPRPLAAPQRIGATEITQLRDVTARLRSADAAHGGGIVHEAILAHLRWAETLLHARYHDTLREELFSAVADAQTLAGWVAHDVGHTAAAQRLLARAAHTARTADNDAHSAVVLHRLGRGPLDIGQPHAALKLFELGQIPAQDSGSPAAMSLLLADTAVAYAHLGETSRALAALRRAEDEFTHLGDESPHYLQFFNSSALWTATARVHTALGATDGTHRAHAIEHLSRALDQAPKAAGGRRPSTESTSPPTIWPTATSTPDAWMGTGRSRSSSPSAHRASRATSATSATKPGNITPAMPANWNTASTWPSRHDAAPASIDPDKATFA